MSIARDLDAYLRERRPFDWHEFNCTQFCATWVERREKRILQMPKSLRAGAHLVREFGGIRNLVDHVLGRHANENLRAAMIGDVVLYMGKRDRFYLGLCNGMRSAFLTSHSNELMFGDTLQCQMFWHVESQA